MKILQIIRSFDPVGGGPMEGICQMAEPLRNLGFDTVVASLDPPDSSFLKGYPFSVHGLGPVYTGYGYRAGITPQILHLAKKCNVVIIHGLWQYHSLSTWRALRSTNIPYFIYPHGMLDPWFKRTYPLKHFKKWLYWHSAEYRVLRDAEAVLFTTEQERRLARMSFCRYRAEERVVGFGTLAPPGNLASHRETFLNRFTQLRGQRILLFLSRIHPKKGVDLLIDAFASVAPEDPSLRLVIAGPDQVGMQAALQRRAAKLGIAGRITWPGMLTGPLKWGAFSSAELFCLPSHQENFGVVVAESLACGVPVAIAHPVNISAEVEQAGAGLLHEDTAAGTTAALQHWLGLSLTERTAMGVRASQLFRERFDFASVARHLLPLLSSS